MYNFVAKYQTLVFYGFLWPLLETVIYLAQCDNLQIHINVNQIARDLTGNCSSSTLQVLFAEGSVLQ